MFGLCLGDGECSDVLTPLEILSLLPSASSFIVIAFFGPQFTVHGSGSTVQGPQSIEMSLEPLPASLLAWLDEWGPGLKKRVMAALQGHGLAGAVVPNLLVGTDCSGIEAPIHALRALDVSHRHCWSSELEEAPRDILLANTPPIGSVYKDVLGSKVQNPEYVQLYISGFSCKPFSTLHHQSKLLGEPQAQIFWSVVDRIMAVRPACFVLENVKGIARVQSQVEKALRGKGFYLVAALKMDPSDLAEPVQRPRIYFFGIRADVAKVSQTQLEEVLEGCWKTLKNGFKVHSPRSRVPLEARMLPNTHSAIVGHQLRRRERWVQAWFAEAASAKS